MKRRDLVRELEKMGCVLIRQGAKHDWYQNPKTKVSHPVPRHRETKVPMWRYVKPKLQTVWFTEVSK